MKYCDEFVRRVNEVYHDVESGRYEQMHPEIFQREAGRWREISRRFIADPGRPLQILDVGCGTGFVPLTIGPALKPGDTVVCADISQGMLDVCKANLAGAGLHCEFHKLSGGRIELPSASFDRITMNSLLHHVPDAGALLAEANRLLVPSGRCVVGHEPNRRFFHHPFLWNHYRCLSVLFSPRQAAGRVLRAAGLMAAARRLTRRLSRSTRAHDDIAARVNEILLGEGAIRRPLSVDELTEIVDVHSPTAGGFHPDRGLDVSELLERYLPSFQLEHLETYDHLCEAGPRNRFTRWYDARLRKRFPLDGSTFLAVLRKRPG